MQEKYLLDTEIDQIYDRYNTWIEEHRFQLIENSLKLCIAPETDDNILLAMMTAVLLIKKSLENYENFFI